MEIKKLINFRTQDSYWEKIILSKIKLMNLYLRHISPVFFRIWILSICIFIFSILGYTVSKLYLDSALSHQILSKSFDSIEIISFSIILFGGLLHLYLTKVLTHLYQWSFYKELSEKIIKPENSKDIDYYYALVTHCANTVKREDTLLWVSVICLYFQENSMVLTRNVFIELLEEIMTDQFIKRQYMSFFECEKKKTNFKIDRETRMELASLKFSLPRNTNLIKWSQFYGWFPHESLSLAFRIFSANTKEEKSIIQLKDKEISHAIYLLPKIRFDNKLINQNFYDSPIKELGIYQSSQKYNKAVQIACRLIKDKIDNVDKKQRSIYPIVGNPEQTVLIKLEEYANYEFPQFIEPV